MRIISWNLLRLEGAAVEDVAALLERERPDLLLMQEVTQHLDTLPKLVPGHYHRLPWPGRIHGLLGRGVAASARFLDMGALGHYMVSGVRRWNATAIRESLTVLDRATGSTVSGVTSPE